MTSQPIRHPLDDQVEAVTHDIRAMVEGDKIVLEFDGVNLLVGEVRHRAKLRPNKRRRIQRDQREGNT